MRPYGTNSGDKFLSPSSSNQNHWLEVMEARLAVCMHTVLWDWLQQPSPNHPKAECVFAYSHMLTNTATGR